MFKTSTATITDGERLIYTVEQTLQILALSRSGLYREVARGRLTGIVINRHTRRFSRAELEKYVAARQAEATAQAQK